MEIEYLINELTNYGVEKDLVNPLDEVYVTNKLLEIFQIAEFEIVEVSNIRPINEILNDMVDYAFKNGIIDDDTVTEKDLFDTKIMGVITPNPSEVINEFWKIYNRSPKEATDYYYDFCIATNYIRADRIVKDERWTSKTEYGVIDITINLSKPEKDPRDIARAGKIKKSGYPACLLCRENEGFAGSLSQPARQNHRIIPIELGGEKYYLQYSPYVYYNHHCIVLNNEHIPMRIDRLIFDKLLDFVRQFPHYMVGSNADLPIVGGSILSHDHFQGGEYTFAMAKADFECTFIIPGYENVKTGIVKWPMSVIRLQGKDKKEIVKCPWGVYHPSANLHHIKKENIGLIEVMGLAVLPARLKDEMNRLTEAILEGKDIRADEAIKKHADWAEQWIDKYDFSKDNITYVIRDEISKVFIKVLECAGVYKRNSKGMASFMRFIETLKNYK